VLATFGRGFYILDNYSPLRVLSKELTEKEAHLFPVKDALMFNSYDNHTNQGQTYYKAPNPEYGATFTWYLKDVPKSKKELRQEAEKKLFKDGKPIPQPSWRELELEGLEENAHLIFAVRDSEGNVVRQIFQEPAKGINRTNWDLRYSMPSSTRVTGKFNPVETGQGGRRSRGGIMVMPGEYTVELALWNEGELKTLAGPVKFTAKKLNNVVLPAIDYAENVAFAKKVSKLSVAMVGADRLTGELINKVENIKQAVYNTPGASPDLMNKARTLSKELENIRFALNGIQAKASQEEIPPAQVPLNNRLQNIVSAHIGNSAGISASEKSDFAILKEEFPPVLAKIKQIVETDIPSLENELNRMNAPWTPGRLPVWNE